MAEKSLKELLLDPIPESYIKIGHHRITQEDVVDFNNLYSEIILLEEEYQQLILGRKDAAQKIVKELELLETMGDLIARGIKKQKKYYKKSAQDLNDADKPDYHKAFEVLKQLASNEKIQYDIRTIQYTAYDSSEHHGYREDKEYNGEVTILAEKEALLKFNCSEKSSTAIRDILFEIYQQGSSILLIGNDEHLTGRLDFPSKQSLGYYQPILFYLQDDELAKATSSFISFVEENGTDIEEIEIDSLVQVIKKKYQRTKN